MLNHNRLEIDHVGLCSTDILTDIDSITIIGQSIIPKIVSLQILTDILFIFRFK